MDYFRLHTRRETFAGLHDHAVKCDGDFLYRKWWCKRHPAKNFDVMRETPTKIAQEMADSLRITKRKVEYNIQRLKKLGLIERSGADKNGKWLVH